MGIATEPKSSHSLQSASASASASAPDMTEFERQNKRALAFSTALMAISLTLLMNYPNPDDNSSQFFLCASTACLEFLCFFTAVGIFFYSSIGQPSAELAKAQKTVMNSSILILLLVFLCRLALLFPFLPFLQITVTVAVFAPLLLLIPRDKRDSSTPPLVFFPDDKKDSNTPSTPPLVLFPHDKKDSSTPPLVLFPHDKKDSRTRDALRSRRNIRPITEQPYLNCRSGFKP